jgi:hypothetical protein
MSDRLLNSRHSAAEREWLQLVVDVGSALPKDRKLAEIRPFFLFETATVSGAARQSQRDLQPVDEDRRDERCDELFDDLRVERPSRRP